MDQSAVTNIVPLPRESRLLAGAAMHFDLDEEAAALRSGDTWDTHDQNARTLIKYDDFRVVLVALKKDAHMKEHQIGQHLTLQSVSGRLLVQMPHGNVELAPGHMMGLDRLVSHEIVALEDAVFLLTMGWSSAPA